MVAGRLDLHLWNVWREQHAVCGAARHRIYCNNSLRYNSLCYNALRYHRIVRCPALRVCHVSNATETSVLAGLQLCFDHAVLADEDLNARLSNSQCITAWATLCARDDILGDWMQEKVRSEPDLPTNPL